MNRNQSGDSVRSLLASPRRPRRFSVHMTSDRVEEADSNKVEHSTSFASPQRQWQRRGSLTHALVSTIGSPTGATGSSNDLKQQKALLSPKKKKKHYNMKPVANNALLALGDEENEFKSGPLYNVTWDRQGSRMESMEQNFLHSSKPNLDSKANDQDEEDDFDCTSWHETVVAEQHQSSSLGRRSNNDIDRNEDNEQDVLASFDSIALRSSFDSIAQRNTTPEDFPPRTLRPSHRDTPILRRENSFDKDLVKEEDGEPATNEVVPFSPRRMSVSGLGPPTRGLRRMPSGGDGSVGSLIPPSLRQESSERTIQRRQSAFGDVTAYSRGTPPQQTPKAPRRFSSMDPASSTPNPPPLATANSDGAVFRTPRRSLSRQLSGDSNGDGPKNSPHLSVSRRLSSDDDSTQQQQRQRQPPQSPRRMATRRFSSEDGANHGPSPRRMTPRRFSSDNGAKHHFHSPRRTPRRMLAVVPVPPPKMLDTPVTDNKKNIALVPVCRVSMEHQLEEHEEEERQKYHQPPRSYTYSSSSSSSASASVDHAFQQRPPRRKRRTRKQGKAMLKAAQRQEYLNHSFNSSFGSLGSGSSSNFFDTEPAENEDVEDIEDVVPPAKKEWELHGFNKDKMAVPCSPVGRRLPAQGCAETTGGEPATIQSTEDETSFSEPDFEGDPASVSETPKLYECAQRFQWDIVAMECSQSPRDAKYVDPRDGNTALHLAIMSRANPMTRDGSLEQFQPAPLSVIKLLIIACPEAAIIRCTTKRYTPLCYACLVSDSGYNMEDSAEMVRILLQYAPHSAFVFTDDGFSALDVHIISYSRLHQHRHEVSNNGRSSTIVLRELLGEHASLAQPRLYGTRMRGPLELLYKCNIKEFKNASCLEMPQGSRGRSVASKLSDWWAWNWTLVLLKASWIPGTESGGDKIAPFSAVHAAAKVASCPEGILSLAVETFPEQVQHRSALNGRFNCPLHEVCGWVTDELRVDGDPFIYKRKRQAIALLLSTFPKAARMTNSLGETPLQLAIETCTPWHQGLEVLVNAFGKALLIPRSLANCPEDGPLAKAMSFQADDLGSVNSNEDEWGDEPIADVEGMYPFLVAAVLSRIPERKRRASSILSAKQSASDRKEAFENKDLESLRSIHGLLRAKPEALDLYIKDERIRRAQDESVGSTDDDDDDEDSEKEESCTEESFEEIISDDESSEEEEED